MEVVFKVNFNHFKLKDYVKQALKMNLNYKKLEKVFNKRSFLPVFITGFYF